jgi:hypothetical protein
MAVAVAAGPAASHAAPAADTAGAGSDHVLGVYRAGPYRIGASLARLTKAGLIHTAWSDPSHPGRMGATSAGAWDGELLLSFQHGRLIQMETAAGAVRTPVGARVGMPFEEIARRYHHHGRFVVNGLGRRAYVVRTGGMVTLLADHPFRPGVGAIIVGPTAFTLAEFLRAGAV